MARQLLLISTMVWGALGTFMMDAQEGKELRACQLKRARCTKSEGLSRRERSLQSEGARCGECSGGWR